jgi:hypothetical protein
LRALTDRLGVGQNLVKKTTPIGRGLSKHPDAAKYVANVDEIADMPILALMRLAKEMGVDAAVIQETEAQDDRLRRYSDNCPAFKGVFEFDLTVEVLGKRVIRKAKAE